MVVGPSPKPLSATFANGTVVPFLALMRSISRVDKSPRARSSSCTRIGTWRSVAENFARFTDTSPTVAIRAASAICAPEIPRSAASSSLGTMRISGRASAAVETTFARTDTFCRGPRSSGTRDRRARWQLDQENRTRQVIGRQEAIRQRPCDHDRAQEDQRPERERDESVAKRPLEHAEIAPHDDALPFDAVLTVAQEICRQERRYQPRDQQRECDRDGDRETELLEILASDAAHEADRHEHGDDGHGRRDYREPDLVRCLERGAIG